MSHISCTALKKGTPRRTISIINHRTWGTRCIKLVRSHTFCACYIDHRWPHSIVFFVIRLPVVLAKQACRYRRIVHVASSRTPPADLAAGMHSCTSTAVRVGIPTTAVLCWLCCGYMSTCVRAYLVQLQWLSDREAPLWLTSCCCAAARV